MTKFPCEARRREGQRCGHVLVNKGKRRVWSSTGSLIAVLCTTHYDLLTAGKPVVHHHNGSTITMVKGTYHVEVAP